MTPGTEWLRCCLMRRCLYRFCTWRPVCWTRPVTNYKVISCLDVFGLLGAEHSQTQVRDSLTRGDNSLIISALSCLVLLVKLDVKVALINRSRDVHRTSELFNNKGLRERVATDPAVALGSVMHSFAHMRTQSRCGRRVWTPGGGAPMSRAHAPIRAPSNTVGRVPGH